jgi:hypothetical protein
MRAHGLDVIKPTLSGEAAAVPDRLKPSLNAG